MINRPVPVFNADYIADVKNYSTVALSKESLEDLVADSGKIFKSIEGCIEDEILGGKHKFNNVFTLTLWLL